MLSQGLRAAAGLAIDVTFLQTAVSVTNASSYTFSSQNLGDAFDGRIIVVGISAFLSSGSFNINTVTVGGVSATRLNRSGGPTTEIATLYAVSLPTGTSANVVVTSSATLQNCGIALWSLRNAEGYQVTAQPNALNTVNYASSQTWTVSSVKKGDAIIVMSRIRSANVGTYSMTGATERAEQVVEATVSAMYAGDVEITQTQSNYEIVVSTSGNSPTTNTTVTRFFV